MGSLSGFTRPADPVDRPQLSNKISADTGKNVWVDLDATQAIVKGSDITESDRAAIQASINSYTYSTVPVTTALSIARIDQVTGDYYMYLTATEKAKLALLSGTNTGDQNLSGLVPTTRQVAGKPLNADVTLVKGDVGLGSVDNTSDVNKPISTATQTALNAKDGVPVFTTLANGTTAMAFGANSAVKVTPNATATYTTTVPAAGQPRQLLVLTSGVSSFTITFGSGFKPTATLVTGTTTARIFVVSWISDGTNLYEVSRTVAMVA